MNAVCGRRPGLRSCLRSYLLLSSTLALAGCAGQVLSPSLNPGVPQALVPPSGQVSPLAPGAYGKTGGNILVLLPLAARWRRWGRHCGNAVKLAAPQGLSQGIDIRDTGGNAAGAAAAAQAGIAAGDGIIIGPLTSAETQGVVPLAKAAGVNMLPFTNDATLAQPGVWPLGITPTQSVQRVLQVASDAGRTQLAALLPDNGFGHHLGDAITAEETQSLSEPAPQIAFYQPGFDSVNQAVDQIADFANRGQGLMDQIKAAKDEGTAAGRAKAASDLQQATPAGATPQLQRAVHRRDR